MSDFDRLNSDLVLIVDDIPENLSVLHDALDESGYTAMWQADKSAEAPGRLDNLKEFVRSMESFESLAGFLEHVSLVMEIAQDESGDRINLMTLHAAKGLEFPYVYIMGLEEDMLPHRNSIAADTVEEERRLMYVGITRARQGLTLTLAEQRKAGGQMRHTTPSRFLDELPLDELEWSGKKKAKLNNVDPKKQAEAYLANLKALLK